MHPTLQGIIAGLIVSSVVSFGALADGDKGIGPVNEVTITTIDPALAKKGGETFKAKCSACHKFEERYVGPKLRGVTERRKPEWIMNMILNPGQMTQEDETAKGLLGEYLTQMTFQNVTQDETRGILEWFRMSDASPPPPPAPSPTPSKKATAKKKSTGKK